MQSSDRLSERTRTRNRSQTNRDVQWSAVDDEELVSQANATEMRGVHQLQVSCWTLLAAGRVKAVHIRLENRSCQFRSHVR